MRERDLVEWEADEWEPESDSDEESESEPELSELESESELDSDSESDLDDVEVDLDEKREVAGVGVIQSDAPSTLARWSSFLLFEVL